MPTGHLLLFLTQSPSEIEKMSRLLRSLLPILTVSLMTICQGAQANRNQVELPLPASGDAVIKDIGRRLLLKIVPDDDGWDVAVLQQPFTDDTQNLLYHSTEWHGPYPSQVMAWHVAKKYFQNTRWLCVRNAPIEVKIEILDPDISEGDDQVRFVGGRLRVAWHHRPCKHEFK